MCLDVLVSAFGLTEIETRGVNGLAILRDDAGLELVISRPIEKFGGGDSVSVAAIPITSASYCRRARLWTNNSSGPYWPAVRSGNRLRRCEADGYFIALRRGEFSSKSVGVQIRLPSQKY